jgi:hypothetical protein
MDHCEAKRHKPWFDEESSELFGRRKQAKLQWLRNQRVVNEDNLSNERRKLVDISGTRKLNI